GRGRYSAEARVRGAEHVGEVAARRRTGGVVHVDTCVSPKRGGAGAGTVPQRLERGAHLPGLGRAAAVGGVRTEGLGAAGAADLVGSGVGCDTEHASCATAVHGHLVPESVPPRVLPRPDLIGLYGAGLNQIRPTVSETGSISTRTGRSSSRSAGSTPR